MDEGKKTEVATLAGGCFWCLEAIFDQLRGVEKVESGYSGGNEANPTYEEVSAETTGHAEAVQITFDPDAILFAYLLKVFFTTHDPTTLDRQGPDVGHQYRSAIFYHTEKQKAIAKMTISSLNKAKVWDAPIVTEVQPFEDFYRAEDHHQDYFKRFPGKPYCMFEIAPKVAKFRKQNLDKLKK